MFAWKKWRHFTNVALFVSHVCSCIAILLIFFAFTRDPVKISPKSCLSIEAFCFLHSPSLSFISLFFSVNLLTLSLLLSLSPLIPISIWEVEKRLQKKDTHNTTERKGFFYDWVGQADKNFKGTHFNLSGDSVRGSRRTQENSSTFSFSSAFLCLYCDRSFNFACLLCLLSFFCREHFYQCIWADLENASH